MKTTILTIILSVIVVTRFALAQETVASGEFQPILTSYLNVKNALTKDNADSARIYAKQLSASVEELAKTLLPSNLKSIWEEHATEIASIASDITRNGDLKKQRTAFAMLSSHLYEIVRRAHVNATDLYYQYCPMHESYWLSEHSSIANPYYGRQMPTCGSTKETLKAAK